MAETRPIGEQLRFMSVKTGAHILDDYLEASEKGNRTLSDMLGDLFDSSGVFQSNLFQFREDPANAGTFQVRVGQFVGADTGWTTITFTDFAQYVADALSHKNAAEAAKTATETARDTALPVINNITQVQAVANDIAKVNTLAAQLDGAVSHVVTVVSGKFHIDGVQAPAIKMKGGFKYTFDLSDTSTATHPFRFSINANGGPVYSTGVTVTGTQGTAGAQLEIEVTNATPLLYYYCTAHSGMGAAADVRDDNLETLSDIDAKITIAADTVAPSIGNVNIVATDIANVNTTAGAIANVNLVGADIANVNAVGQSIANVNTVQGNLTAINTAASYITNIGTVASSITDINDVITNLADIQTSAANVGAGKDITITAAAIGSVTAVASNISNVNSVATNMTKVIEVANDLIESISEIDTVASSITNVDAVGTSIANVNLIAQTANLSNVTNVGTNITDVNTLAGISSKISSLADIEDGTVSTNALSDLHTNLSVIQPLGANITNIVTVANSIGNINTVVNPTNLGNITTVSGAIANVNLVGGSVANINSVAAVLSDVSNVASNSSDISTVASNVANIVLAGQNVSQISTAATYINQIVQAPNFASDAKKYATHGVNSTFTDSDGNIEYSAKHYAATAQAVGTAFTTVIGDERTTSDTDDITADNGADSLTLVGLGGAKVRTSQTDDKVFIDSRAVAMAVALG